MINLNADDLLKQYREAQEREIERLLTQYGTSLQETREMYPQLISTIEKQREVSFPGQELFMSASEAAQLGLSLQEGWMLKFTPQEQGYGLSFITPEKWEIQEGGTYVSPTGETYTRADIEALLTEPTGSLSPTELARLPEDLTVEALTEEGQALYERYQAEGGQLSVARWLKLLEQERLETEQIFGKVFPQEDIAEVLQYARDQPEQFLAELREIGRTEETEALLRLLAPDITEEHLEDIFEPVMMAPEVQESKWKDVWDRLYLGITEFGYNTKQYILGTLPRMILDVIGGRSIFVAPTRPEEQRGWFRLLYEPTLDAVEVIQQNYEEREAARYEWLMAHPELYPREEWAEGAIETIQANPKVLLDPAYVAYLAVDAAIYTGSFLAAATATSAITGNPALGVMAGVAVTTPALSHDLYADLRAAGATEQQAAQLAVPIGAVIGSVEVIGGMAVLKAISPAFYQSFRANAQKEIVRRSLGSLLKKGLKTFTEIEITETLEEVIQGAIQDATVKTFDENRDLLENIPETVVHTLIATLPLAIIGGGRHTSYIYKNMTAEQKAQIQQDTAAFEAKGIPADYAELLAINRFQETEEGRAVVERAVEEAAGLPEFQTGKPSIEQDVEARIQEVQGILATKGVRGRANLELELATLQAQLEVMRTKAAHELDFTISQIETELGLRSMSYHGARKGLFPEYTTRQLEEMLRVYRDARQQIEDVGMPKAKRLVSVRAGDIATKGWEKVAWQSIRLQAGKWLARLTGEKSKVVLAEQELDSRPTQRVFKALEGMLKRRREIRYDPKTGKYIKVRRIVTHVTKANWDALSVEQRMKAATSAGLAESVGFKSWDSLTMAEKVTLKTSAITLPEVQEARDAWDRLSVPERVALAKSVGLEGKLGSKSWQALTKKEAALLRNLVISEKVRVTKQDAQDAARELVADAVIEEAGLTRNPDVVQKLTELIREAEPIRKITEGLKHEELIKRAGRAAAILDSAQGRDAFQKSKSALEGALPKADFAPPELQLTSEEVNELFNRVKESDLQYFEKLNTAEALGKLLAGEIPTEGELELLQKIFGPELAEAIMSKRGRGAWEAVLDVLNLPRAVLASWDLSAPLRQGATLFWGQPKEALPAMVPMVKAFVSEANARAVDEVINSGPYAQLRRDAGLYIAPLYDVVPKLARREEAFMTSLAKYIPLVSHSERAYVTYLNKLRADVFDSYARQWEGTGKTMADYKALASAINIMTGRGPLGKLSHIGAFLNAMFFSPRYQASRIMMPVEFLRTTPTVRKIMARNILAFVSANLTILALAVLAFKDSEEPAYVETDPRSTDFGKLKIGNTRLDFWASFQQYARAICQLITGMRIVSTTGRLTEVQRSQVLDQFARSKLSPIAGLVSDLLRGETYIGDELSLEPESVRQQAFERLVPMWIQDMVEAIEDSGITGALLALPGCFGVGVQTYGGGYWEEFTDKLGKPEQSEALPYSVNVEDIYTTKDFYGDVSPRVTGMTRDDIKPQYQIPELVQSVIAAKAVKETYHERARERLIDINADVSQGDTYENYYVQWQQYQKLTTDEERATFKQQYPYYYKGNFSRQTLALLDEYHSLDRMAQDDFLREHPEIAVSPRDQWLREHPEENALLALWGQANILTSAAYDALVKLSNQLDIPQRAIEYVLPPIACKENYFKYLDIGQEYGWNSWEARLLMLEDDELRQWLGREPVEDHIEALKLQVKWRDLTVEYEGYGDRDSPYYIADKDARGQIRRIFKDAHPDWVVDMARVDAYRLGFPEEQIENYVEYYSLPDKGYERERYLLEHADFYNSMIELKGLVPLDSDYRVPASRYDEIYHEYEELFEAYDNVTGTESQRAAKREQILSDNPEFARARLERQAYGLFFPENLIDDYVDWYSVKRKDYEDDWWLMDHPDFYEAMLEMGIWKQEKDFSKVPTREVWAAYQVYLSLPTGTPRLDYRVKHPDLDAWLVLAKGYKPVSGRGSPTAEKTPWQEAAEVQQFKSLFGGG
ncbi:MAG: hypothetical protein ACLFVD_01175 [Dehalococcoidia bacterium]